MALPIQVYSLQNNMADAETLQTHAHFVQMSSFFVCVWGGCLIVNRCYFESFNYDCMTKTEIVFNTYDNTKHEKAFIKRFTYEDVKMLTQNMHTHTCRRELCSQKHFHILSFKIYFY